MAGLNEIDALDPGELDSASPTLAPGRLLVLGVCDDDCAYLDLMVFDTLGNVFGQDIELDAEPTVQFNVKHQVEYPMGVEMVTCEAENCLYVDSIFREE